MTFLFDIKYKLPVTSWRCLFEQARRLKGLLVKVPLVFSSSLTSEVGLASVAFVKVVFRLWKKSGPLHTALYLKQCGVCLQQYWSAEPGAKGVNRNLSTPISLTRGGLPATIIPAVLRKQIRLRGDRGKFLVRLYLSWFSLAKLIEAAPRVRKSTFSSLMDVPLNPLGVKEVIQDMERSFSCLLDRYLPSLPYIPLYKGIVWEPTWKSVPLQDSILLQMGHVMGHKRRKMRVRYKRYPNIFCNLIHECASFALNMDDIRPIRGVVNPGSLFQPRVHYPLDYEYNESMTAWDGSYYVTYIGKYFSTCLAQYGDLSLNTGRLAQVLEGSGKRRLFVISNYVKQRLLKPVHTWAMEVLRSIPMDGTFDQTAPLYRLRVLRPTNISSFDLKSATDRWPLAIISALQKLVWGDDMGKAIVESALGLNTISLGPPIVRKHSTVAFRTGQPLGFYGSWALFALSHHVIVWLAALKALPELRGPFRRYALLGDDITIADPDVAREYLLILYKLGVKVSLPKSLVSRTGCLEFAKRFWVESLQVDLSPVSLRAIWNSRTLIGIVGMARSYHQCDFRVLCRLNGAGYRVCSRLSSSSLTKKWERVRVVSRLPVKGSIYPFEFWLGRGNPLNPYLKARLIRLIMKEMKPKQLSIPFYGLLDDDEIEFNERTVLRNWMQQWLAWVRWYVTLNWNADIPLDRLISSCPVCAHSWIRSDFDISVFKFGLVWRMYDLAGDWDLQRVDRNLFPTPSGV